MTEISKKLDDEFDAWLQKKLDVYCFDKRNPFTDEEIKGWDKKTAEFIIHVITPAQKRQQPHEEQTINRIKDLHAIV